MNVHQTLFGTYLPAASSKLYVNKL